MTSQPVNLEPRSTYTPWAVTGLAAAAIVVIVGNAHVNHAAGEHGGLGPAVATGSLCLVAAALLFVAALPRLGSSRRAATVLAVLSIASLAVFWTGLPAVLGTAAAALDRRTSGSLRIPGWLGLAAMTLAAGWTLISQTM
jgi:hypothetical protein